MLQSASYWLMLAPFTPSQHLITIHVEAPDTFYGSIIHDIVHHLTVQ